MIVVKQIFNTEINAKLYDYKAFDFKNDNINDWLLLDINNNNYPIDQKYRLIENNSSFLFNTYHNILNSLSVNKDEIDIINILIDEYIQNTKHLNLILLKVLLHFINIIHINYDQHCEDDNQIVKMKSILNHILKNKYYDPTMCQKNIYNIFRYYLEDTELDNCQYGISNIFYYIVKHKNLCPLISNIKFSSYFFIIN